MKLKTCIKITFSSAHMLKIIEEKIHGHNYILEICFTKENPKPWVEDFRKLKEIVKNVINEIDHKLLLPETECNKYKEIKEHIKCLPISEITCEELIQYIVKEVERKLNELGKNLKIVNAKLYETETSYVEIEL